MDPLLDQSIWHFDSDSRHKSKDVKCLHLPPLFLSCLKVDRGKLDKYLRSNLSLIILEVEAYVVMAT